MPDQEESKDDWDKWDGNKPIQDEDSDEEKEKTMITGGSMTWWLCSPSTNRPRASLCEIFSLYSFFGGK